MPPDSPPAGDATDYARYGKHFNEPDLSRKIQSLPSSAIRQVLEKALLLRELLNSDTTPLWAWGMIVGVLGYLILPLDLVPDLIPVAGYVDDVAAMALVLAQLEDLIMDESRRSAREKLPDFLRGENKTDANPTSTE